MVSERQIGGNLLMITELLCFPLRTTAQQQWRTMIAFGQDHVKDDWTHLSVNLHPEVLGQDVLTDNPQMKSDQKSQRREHNMSCKMNKNRMQSKVLGFKQKNKNKKIK